MLRLCAARTSTELNLASMSNELGIPALIGSAYRSRLVSAFPQGAGQRLVAHAPQRVEPAQAIHETVLQHIQIADGSYFGPEPDTP